MSTVQAVMDTIRDQLDTLVPGTLTEVFQGRKRFAEGTHLEEATRQMTAETKGKFSYWVDSRTMGNPSSQSPDAHSLVIAGELQVNCPTEDTSDLNDLYDLAEEIGSLLVDESVFAAIGAVPGGVSWAQVEDGRPRSSQMGIVYIGFIATYSTGPSNC
jgi:hypothetical protein